MTASRYFAYGSNMSPRQMAERCPGAVAVGAARLDGYRLAFDRESRGRWGGFVADVVRDEAGEVWGVLWEVTVEHLEALDRFEGVAAGGYRRVEVFVAMSGDELRAITYVVCEPGAEGDPSPAYSAVMAEGVEAFRVPRRRPDGTSA